jgi:hypothetical protein
MPRLHFTIKRHLMKLFNCIKGSLLVLILFVFIGCTNKQEVTAKMTIEKWKDAIENLFNTLEITHINLYHSTSKNNKVFR